MKEAKVKMEKVTRMGSGARANCCAMDSWDDNSAATAETNPSIARRPLMVSGASPVKAMTSASKSSTGGGRTIYHDGLVLMQGFLFLRSVWKLKLLLIYAAC